MAVIMAQVRAVLDATEPDYVQAAKLGPEALPHVEKLVKDADALLASKAVYLAALIQDERSVRIVREAALREDPIVRVAAAGAAPYLPCVPMSDILIPLVNDKDGGVQRVALESVRADATAELRATIERLTTDESDPSIQRAAKQVLRRISLGHQPDYGSAEEDASGMGGSQEGGGGMGNPASARGMGGPGSTGGMGRPGSAGGIAQIGMGRQTHGAELAAGGGMGQRSTGGTDESTAAAWEKAAMAWEKAAAAWEKKRRCGCGSRSQ